MLTKPFKGGMKSDPHLPYFFFNLWLRHQCQLFASGIRDRFHRRIDPSKMGLVHKKMSGEEEGRGAWRRREG